MRLCSHTRLEQFPQFSGPHMLQVLGSESLPCNMVIGGENPFLWGCKGTCSDSINFVSDDVGGEVVKVEIIRIIAGYQSCILSLFCEQRATHPKGFSISLPISANPTTI
jgi:hypothetical protein